MNTNRNLWIALIVAVLLLILMQQCGDRFGIIKRAYKNVDECPSIAAIDTAESVVNVFDTTTYKHSGKPSPIRVEPKKRVSHIAGRDTVYLPVDTGAILAAYTESVFYNDEFTDSLNYKGVLIQEIRENRIQDQKFEIQILRPQSIITKEVTVTMKEPPRLKTRFFVGLLIGGRKDNFVGGIDAMVIPKVQTSYYSYSYDAVNNAHMFRVGILLGRQPYVEQDGKYIYNPKIK